MSADKRTSLNYLQMYPGLNDFADVLESVPLSIISDMTRLKEAVAKEGDLGTDLSSSVDKFFATRDSQCLANLDSVLDKLIPTLVEKMQVASKASDSLQREIERLNVDYKLICENEIPEIVQKDPNDDAFLEIVPIEKQASARAQARREARESREARRQAQQESRSGSRTGTPAHSGTDMPKRRGRAAAADKRVASNRSTRFDSGNNGNNGNNASNGGNANPAVHGDTESDYDRDSRKRSTRGPKAGKDTANAKTELLVKPEHSNNLGLPLGDANGAIQSPIHPVVQPIEPQHYEQIPNQLQQPQLIQNQQLIHTQQVGQVGQVGHPQPGHPGQPEHPGLQGHQQGQPNQFDQSQFSHQQHEQHENEQYEQLQHEHGHNGHNGQQGYHQPGQPGHQQGQPSSHYGQHNDHNDPQRGIQGPHGQLGQLGQHGLQSPLQPVVQPVQPGLNLHSEQHEIDPVHTHEHPVHQNAPANPGPASLPHTYTPPPAVPPPIQPPAQDLVKHETDPIATQNGQNGQNGQGGSGLPPVVMPVARSLLPAAAPEIAQGIKRKHNAMLGSEPTYCYCERASFGEMVGCDGPNCEREWFHLGCIGLTALPKGQWFCTECRAKLRRK